MNLTIGSGDVKKILMGKHTKGYQEFLQKFVSSEKQIYNSFASPINALRTGAILESRYLLTLPENYYCQYKSTFKEMDVFVSSIDFAEIDLGQIISFDELKTIWLTDYLDLIQPLKDKTEKEQTEFLQKSFKDNYVQVQCQLMCSELNEANLVFLSVESYDDEVNENRIIKETDYVKFKIKRDESIISKIKKEGNIFQLIKNNFKDER
jgi:hypothetical protein